MNTILKARSPERRLVSLADQLSEIDGKALELCQLMGVNPERHYPSDGQSAFSNCGSPLQLNLSSNTQGTKVRILADPQTKPVAWPQRRQDAYLHLERLLGSNHNAAFAKACNDIAAICLPEKSAEKNTKSKKAGLAFGMEISTPGLAVYGYGPWNSTLESWTELVHYAKEILPAPKPILELIDTISSTSVLHGIGIAGTNVNNARIKLYWKFSTPTRVDQLGLPLGDHQPFALFLNELSKDATFGLDSFYFCAGFDYLTGIFRDFKIDACCCDDCCCHSQARLVQFTQRIAQQFNLNMMDIRSVIYKQDARISLIGLGCDYKGEIRLNTYLSPTSLAPIQSNPNACRDGQTHSDYLKDAVERAVSFLGERQLPCGAFLSNQSPSSTLYPEFGQEISTFVTSNILYGLGFVSNEKSTAISHLASNFLLAEMKKPGYWHYWSALYRTDLPADLDDTCCAALVLNNKVPEHIYKFDPQLLLRHRNDDGLFFTWTKPYEGKNDIDSVVNANVVAAFGDCPEVIPACDYLIDIVMNGTEAESYWYYLSDSALHYALSRAIYLGVNRLDPIKDIILERISNRVFHDDDSMSTLNVALELCSLINLQSQNHDLCSRLANQLVKLQNSNGSWDKVAYYGGKTPPGPKTIFFGSQESVSGFCIEALARYSKMIKGESNENN